MEDNKMYKHAAYPRNNNHQHHNEHSGPNMRNKGPRYHKEKPSLDKYKLFNILCYIFAGMLHISFVLIVVWSIKFTSLSTKTFIFLYILLGLLLTINDIVLIVGFKYKDFVIKCISCAISIFLLISGVFGSALVGKINKTTGKVIQNDSKDQYETVSVSFITYDNSVITSISDLGDKKVGVVASTTTDEDATSAGKNKLIDEKIAVTYKEYDSMVNLYTGLIKKEIDAAIMPSSYNTLLSDLGGFDEALKKTTAIKTIEVKLKTGESTGYNKNLVSEPFTVLLIGYAQESQNYGLADSVILCSVNPLTYQVAMVSLARDSYVPICGGGYDKLAHSRGQSRSCLIQTVEDVMDEEVDFYMEINFQGVVDVVDALGGIIINNPVEFVGQSPSIERGNMTVWVPEGEFLANGEQALAFARERHIYAAGDFARQEHQQQVIKAIAEGLLDLKDVSKALKILDAAGNNFTTNFSLEQLSSLFNYIISNGSNTGVSAMNQIQIFSSRLTGYSSWHWNESAQLALWIYRIWNGSVKDNKWLIDKVLGKEDIKGQFYKYTISHEGGYEEYYSFPDTYSETQIHEQLPTSVPNLVGMTLSDVQTWAKDTSVTLGINYIETTDSTLVGKVKSQSPESGTSLDNCGHYVSIDVYSAKVEKVTVPTFTTAAEVQTWATTNGMVYATIEEVTTDSTLHGKYKGTNPAAGTEMVKGQTITSIVYKYVAPATFVVPTFTSAAEVQTWATTNGMTYATATQTTADSTLDGQFAGTTPAAGSNITTGGTITALIYSYVAPVTPTSYIVPTFASAEEVQTWAATNGMTYATATQTTDDASLDGQFAGTNPTVGATMLAGETITSLFWSYVDPTTP